MDNDKIMACKCYRTLCLTFELSWITWWKVCCHFKYSNPESWKICHYLWKNELNFLWL